MLKYKEKNYTNGKIITIKNNLSINKLNNKKKQQQLLYIYIYIL